MRQPRSRAAIVTWPEPTPLSSKHLKAASTAVVAAVIAAGGEGGGRQVERTGGMWQGGEAAARRDSIDERGRGGAKRCGSMASAALTLSGVTPLTCRPMIVTNSAQGRRACVRGRTPVSHPAHRAVKVDLAIAILVDLGDHRV